MSRDFHPPKQACLFHLSHLTCLKVEGEDAQQFLQGQLTCDVRQVSATQAQPGALCNLKGRVIALMDIVLWQAIYHLILPKNLVSLVLKDLKLVAQISRVRLTTDESLHCFGLYDPAYKSTPNYQTSLSENQVCYTLNQGLSHILSAKKLSSHVDFQHWHQLLIHCGHPSIHPETSGQFLLHQLDLDAPPYVNFDKGCYKGQEIIARMHYLGKNKYHTQTSVLKSPTPLCPGMALKDPVGEIIDAVPISENTYLVRATVFNQKCE